jgi:hypothetical protein
MSNTRPGKSRASLLLHSLTFASLLIHSLSDINSPCLSTVLLILPSFSNSPKMRSMFSSLISIERRRSVRVIEPPFWAKIQRIRSRWLYGCFFIAAYHASAIYALVLFITSKCIFRAWLNFLLASAGPIGFYHVALTRRLISITATRAQLGLCYTLSLIDKQSSHYETSVQNVGASMSGLALFLHSGEDLSPGLDYTESVNGCLSMQFHRLRSQLALKALCAVMWPYPNRFS